MVGYVLQEYMVSVGAMELTRKLASRTGPTLNTLFTLLMCGTQIPFALYLALDGSTKQKLHDMTACLWG